MERLNPAVLERILSLVVRAGYEFFAPASLIESYRGALGRAKAENALRRGLHLVDGGLRHGLAVRCRLVEKIHGALRVRGSREDRALVLAEDLEPVREV